MDLIGGGSAIEMWFRDTLRRLHRELKRDGVAQGLQIPGDHIDGLHIGVEGANLRNLVGIELHRLVMDDVLEGVVPI